MSVMAATYKCDRDGTEIAGAPPNVVMTPEGWVNMNFSGHGVSPFSGHLCPACAEAFVAFMGGNFTLTQSAPPPPVQEPASS
jgi:hypothetical protein